MNLLKIVYLKFVNIELSFSLSYLKCLQLSGERESLDWNETKRMVKKSEKECVWILDSGQTIDSLSAYL